MRQRIRTDLSLAIAVNPQLTELFAKAMPEHDPEGPIPNPSDFDLSVAEGIQAYNYAVAYVRYLEDQFFSDLPETDRYALESQVKAITGSPYMMKFWERSKNIFDPRFQEYVDDLNR